MLRAIAGSATAAPAGEPDCELVEALLELLVAGGVLTDGVGQFEVAEFCWRCQPLKAPRGAAGASAVRRRSMLRRVQTDTTKSILAIETARDLAERLAQLVNAGGGNVKLELLFKDGRFVQGYRHTRFTARDLAEVPVRRDS